MKRRAVFLDKDGTILENIPHNIDPLRMRLAPGADQALPQLQEAGYALVIISNQPGVAHGYFDEGALRGVEARLRRMFMENGAELAGFYYCPHDPMGFVDPYRSLCTCRKPLPGLLFQAADDLNLELRVSWMIGDILHDVEAGHHANCKTILINNGNETEWNMTLPRTPDYMARNLAEAAEIVSYHPASLYLRGAA
jgi:D-glycero-D-manno-heptose 1,7-bisphosphate phosphatase